MREVLEALLPFERNLFFALNGSESTLVDNIIWTLSGRFVWIPMILFIISLLFYRRPVKEALLIIFFLALILLICDQLSSSLIKPMFERFRPTHHPDFKDLVKIVNGYRGGRYGFVSGHATNSFGIALFVSLIFKYHRLTISSFLWAALNSYTRIYLGVHFISDIVAGAIVGMFVTATLYLGYIALQRKLVSAGSFAKEGEMLEGVGGAGKLLYLFILLYTALLIILSPLLSTLPH